MSHGSPVVVGLEDFLASREALTLAAAEAALRAAPLRIVHALPPAGPVIPPATITAVVEPTLESAARSLIDEAAAQVRQAYPDLEVRTDVSSVGPVLALLHEAESAQLLVVGASRGGLGSLLLGSTADALIRHASCPVLVARSNPGGERGPAAGEIVVGVDGSEVSLRAVEFAFAEASLRGSAVTAVHAVPVPALAVAEAAPPPLLDPDTQTEEALVLAESLAGWQEKYPDVHVTRRLVEGSPGRVLTDYSQGAELLVVGSRGRGGFTKLLLGSTSYTVLHKAACPVAVLPLPRQSTRAGG